MVFYTVPRSVALLLSLEGKGAHTTITLFLKHDDSMLSLVRNTVILQCFDAVVWVTGRASAL